MPGWISRAPIRTDAAAFGIQACVAANQPA